MAKQENLYSSVLDGIVGIVEEVSDNIAGEFKGKAPFDKEAIPDDELLYEYITKGFETFMQIANTQGLEAGKNYISEMEELKSKKQGGA